MYPNFNKPAFLTSTPTTGFGTNNSNSNALTFGRGQLFGKTTAGGFGTTPSTSTFGQPTTNTSMFSTLQPSGLFQTGNTSTFNAGPSTQAGFSSNLFGQQQQPTTSSLFGSGTNAFGANKTTFGFGSTQNQTGLFGQPQQPQQTGSSLFQSNTPNIFASSSTFGNQGQMGTVVKFQPVTGTDTMQKNGVAQSICTKHHCITCMKEYESKSLEELRFEDYNSNRKGPQQQTGFGSPGFGSTTTNPPSLFGQVDKPTVLGQSTGFAAQTGSTFGQNTSGFGLQTNQTTTPSIFGKTTGFGAPNSNTSSFGFNTAPSTTNPFGATNQATKPFSQSLFGTNTTQQSGFGGGVFGQTNTQNTSGGLFSKPTQTNTGFNTGQTGFAFNPPTTTFQVSKPNTGFGLFGQTNTATTGGFGQNNQTSFGTNFGKPVAQTFGQPTQPSFGQLQQPSNLFGNTANKPGGLFGNTNTGSGLFSNTTFQQQPGTFNLQATQQQQMQFPPQNTDEAKNIQLLATDIIADGPHIYGLKPILSNPADSATNPQDIKALLDISKNENYLKKSEIPTSSKIKVQSPKPKRNSNKEFFDANFALKSSRKCLIIKKHNENKSENIYKKYDNELLKEVEESLKKSLNNDDNETVNQIELSNIQFTPEREREIIPRINNIINNDLDGGIVTSTILDTQPSTSKQNPIIDISIDNITNNNANNTINNLTDEIIVTPTITNSNEDDNNYESSYGVTLSRPEYYMYPELKDLHQYIDENGDCIIQGLTIGRYGYGNVYFPDPINITNMNFDQIVHFRHREIIIYPDETIKPAIGQGLNRRAQVTLDKIFPRDKDTNNYVTDIDEITRSNFVDKLITVTEKHNSKFVEYRPKTGSWVFKVKHFSKFSFTDSDEEECKISIKNDEIIEDEFNKKLLLLEKTDEITKIGLGGHSTSSNNFLTTTTTNRLQVLMQPQDMISEESLLATDWTNNDDYFVVDDELLQTKTSKSSLIQTMKSALFQQPLDSSQSLLTATTTNNIAAVDDENLLQNFIGEQEVCKEVISVPKIFPVPSLYTALPEDYFSSQLRCYIDLSVFKGDAYKVGWSKGLNFYKLQRIYDFKMSYELNEASMETQDDSVMTNLTEALQITLNESEFSFNSSSTPTLKIRNNLNYLQKQTKLFNDLIDCNDELMYLSSVWHLCSALWDGDDNTDCIRRQRLSDWFKIFTNNDNTDDYIINSASKLSNEKQAIESVFKLLTYNKVIEAARLAINNNFDYLSLLISQLSAKEESKIILKKYVETYSWQIKKIPDEFKKVYLLLAGISTPHQNVNIFEKLDWKRCFGIHLWYIAPAAAPIHNVVNLYKQTFEEFAYATHPLPPYSTSTDDYNNETIIDEYDLIYHILLLYIRNTYHLCFVLNPATYTNNLMDYRLSWLLLQLFLSLKVGLIQENEENYLHTSFASQLEHLKMWKWSIFVLLYIKDDIIKKNLIMKVLERNLSGDNKTFDIEQDLVNTMKIPSDWIHEVKGNKTKSSGNYHESFKHFALIKNWNKANEIFVNNILPNLFINNQYKYLKYFINCIEPGEKSITNWNSETGLIKDFMELQEMIVSFDENEMIPIRIRFNSICQRLCRFPIINDQQKLCIAELSRKCATLFKVFYKNCDLQSFQAKFIDLIDNLIMPADYKHYEIFNLIGHSLSR